ncbi:hypothetical protein FHG87_023201, partial [Trinorchestia longiramus]
QREAREAAARGEEEQREAERQRITEAALRRRQEEACQFCRVAYSEHLTAAVARSRPAELRLRMEALRLQGLEKVLSRRAERNLHFLVKKLN